MRKGAIEADLVMESEISDIIGKAGSDNAFDPSGKHAYMATSPVSVASGFNDLESMPEMKPIMLPSAWVVVGKGGRPVRNLKMYEEPQKKKKRRSRPRKPAAEPESVYGALHDLPSSSKCYQTCAASAMRREKEVTRAKELRFWVRYQKAKAAKKLARDDLIAALVAEGVLDANDAEAAEVASPPTTGSPSPRRARRSEAAKRYVKETRRDARRAAAAARCGTLYDVWDDDVVDTTHPVERHGSGALAPSGAKERARPAAARAQGGSALGAAKQAAHPPGAAAHSPAEDPEAPTAWKERRASKGRQCSLM